MPSNTQRPRGRPVGGRAFERSEVVAAALDAIAEGGYSGLTMRGVARSIGASLATVQRHFPTKADLWRGAIDDFFDGFQDPTLTTSSAALVEGIEELLGSSSARPGLIATLLTDRSPGHVERHVHIADRLAARHERVRRIIGELQAEGSVRNVDLDALLLLLNVGVGMLMSASGPVQDLYGFDPDDPADITRLAESIADIVSLGITAR